MARIRSIKPEMRTSITVSMWPREVRYFFILLWGYFDDYGRGVDDELLIASDCFPRDRDITPERVDAWLEMIADSGPLCRYEVDGRQYLHAPNWREHQKPSHPTRSKIPPCPDDEPDDFKTWRSNNPQRLRNRSRKSREGFESFPEGLPGASQTPSGEALRAVSDTSTRDVYATSDHDAFAGSWSDEPAGQDGHEDAPESLPKESRDAPDSFVPELGSKGAREQGSEGVWGRGGEASHQAPPSAGAKPQRPDGRPSLHELPDDFELTDGMRKWAHQTYPRVDVDHETQKFIWHHRDEGRRKRNWYGAWQKWIAGANQYLLKHGNQPSNVVRLHNRPGGARSPEPTAEKFEGLTLKDVL